MRIAVLGGTRFIGRAAAKRLADEGNDVLIVHRGNSEPPELATAHHLHVERARLGEAREAFAAFRPDVVIDSFAMSRADAEAALAAIPAMARIVVLSSCDVYRAYAAFTSGTVSDPVPLDETAAVRGERYPYRGKLPGMDDYEKLDVEEAYLARGATVLRLGFVYGPGDPQRREEFVLRRLRAGRARIPFGAGNLLLSRLYVDDAAKVIALTAAHEGLAGEVLNVVEQRSPTVRLWAEQILAAAGMEAELVHVPERLLPPDLQLTAAAQQHMLFAASKARSLLGWQETDPAAAVAESVRWHLAHPPEDNADFSADDMGLAAAQEGSG